MSRSTRSPSDWTYEDYARLPDDGNRYEILDGEVLVTPGPSPKHQSVSRNLILALHPYVERHGLGVVLQDVDLLFEEGQYLRPDLVFVPASARAGITERGIESAPALVIEILSPTSGAIDHVRKPRRYADFGVPEYWLADRFKRAMWIYDLATGGGDPRCVEDRLIWRPAGASEALDVDVAELFVGA
ncbi:MAG: Uma2 family endonuclease [Longimicrobiales bacterium]